MDVLQILFQWIQDSYNADQTLNLQILVHRKNIKFMIKGLKSSSLKKMNAAKRHIYRLTPAPTVCATIPPSFQTVCETIPPSVPTYFFTVPTFTYPGILLPDPVYAADPGLTYSLTPVTSPSPHNDPSIPIEVPPISNTIAANPVLPISLTPETLSIEVLPVSDTIVCPLSLTVFL